MRPLFRLTAMMGLLASLVMVLQVASGFAPCRPSSLALRPARMHYSARSDGVVSPSSMLTSWISERRRSATSCPMAQVSQQEAQIGINQVVAALRKDKTAQSELGRLEKVTIVLGFGSPSPGTLAVRFNASFRKSGMGRSTVPLPFGLGQSDKQEGRGTMVGQVKASIKDKKITSCSVFRDLGYGRSFELRV